LGAGTSLTSFFFFDELEDLKVEAAGHQGGRHLGTLGTTRQGP